MKRPHLSAICTSRLAIIVRDKGNTEREREESNINIEHCENERTPPGGGGYFLFGSISLDKPKMLLSCSLKPYGLSHAPIKTSSKEIAHFAKVENILEFIARISFVVAHQSFEERGSVNFFNKAYDLRCINFSLCTRLLDITLCLLDTLGGVQD
jgi:hypothetical protein